MKREKKERKKRYYNYKVITGYNGSCPLHTKIPGVFGRKFDVTFAAISVSYSPEAVFPLFCWANFHKACDSNTEWGPGAPLLRRKWTEICGNKKFLWVLYVPNIVMEMTLQQCWICVANYYMNTLNVRPYSALFAVQYYAVVLLQPAAIHRRSCLVAAGLSYTTATGVRIEIGCNLAAIVVESSWTQLRWRTTNNAEYELGLSSASFFSCRHIIKNSRDVDDMST